MSANEELTLMRKRLDRLENRIDVLERDNKALLDVTAALVHFAGEHVRDRHDVDLQRDDAPDVIFVRKARVRFHKWLDDAGPLARKRDVTEVRRSENRVKPDERINELSSEHVVKGNFPTALALPPRTQEQPHG